MPAIEYRIFFNNNPATREQLDRVEEITVEQEVDMVWEARLQIPIQVDENGNWTGEDEDFMETFSQTRVEIRIGNDSFIPLIDGPIVGFDSPMSSEPGQSSITLNVRDDSIYLNREEVVARHENRLDHEIAEQLFRECAHIGSIDVEDTPSPGGSLSPVVVQRGTAMQLLRTLARRQGKHAYVLPSDNPGQSVGCFKAFPNETDGLPSLTLLGAERNIESFNPAHDGQRPSTARASTIRITDKTVITGTSRSTDIERLGDDDTFESESDMGTHILPPRHGESVDLDQTVASEAADSSYALEATGSVSGNCYHGVLSPYRVVSVRGANRRLSGNYLISRVTHTLTRSSYSQSFSLRRNSESACSPGGSLSDSVRGIF